MASITIRNVPDEVHRAIRVRAAMHGPRVMPLPQYLNLWSLRDGVLAGVNLDIRRGEFLSLLGPSGCGKSTVLRLVAGLTTPTEGAIEWGEGDHTLGFVSQEPTLMPWATVFDNILLPLKLKGAEGEEATMRVEAVLDRVGLAAFAGAYPRELSGEPPAYSR